MSRPLFLCVDADEPIDYRHWDESQLRGAIRMWDLSRTLLADNLNPDRPGLTLDLLHTAEAEYQRARVAALLQGWDPENPEVDYAA